MRSNLRTTRRTWCVARTPLCQGSPRRSAWRPQETFCCIPLGHARHRGRSQVVSAGDGALGLRAAIAAAEHLLLTDPTGGGTGGQRTACVPKKTGTHSKRSHSQECSRRLQNFVPTGEFQVSTATSGRPTCTTCTRRDCATRRVREVDARQRARQRLVVTGGHEIRHSQTLLPNSPRTGIPQPPCSRHRPVPRAPPVAQTSNRAARAGEQVRASAASPWPAHPRSTMRDREGGLLAAATRGRRLATGCE